MLPSTVRRGRRPGARRPLPSSAMPGSRSAQSCRRFWIMWPGCCPAPMRLREKRDTDGRSASLTPVRRLPPGERRGARWDLDMGGRPV